MACVCLSSVQARARSRETEDEKAGRNNAFNCRRGFPSIIHSSPLESCHRKQLAAPCCCRSRRHGMRRPRAQVLLLLLVALEEKAREEPRTDVQTHNPNNEFGKGHVHTARALPPCPPDSRQSDAQVFLHDAFVLIIDRLTPRHALFSHHSRRAGSIGQQQEKQEAAADPEEPLGRIRTTTSSSSAQKKRGCRGGGRFLI